ncbi:TniB family NTP-binding protein [Streptomyces sp. NPDC048290]|uniref:TniB family NTP-binding protein n=1 Tax=Streptomyces sp. NPDC048290 TaxID=3155811 RepID=UPI003437659F
MWPDRLVVGDRVRFDGHECTVTGVCGGRVALLDGLGATEHIDVLTLLAAQDFAFVGRGTEPDRQEAPPLPESVLAQARWWRRHVTEVLDGVPYGAPPGTTPRSAYDPARFSLAEREEAKARELAEQGIRGASARTVRRKRQRYQQQGLAGLTDGRAGPRTPGHDPVHPRVEAVVQDLLASQLRGQHLRTEQLHDQVLTQLAVPIAAGEVPRPSRAAVRLVAARLLANAAGGRVGRPAAVAVGERVHLDVVELSLPSGEGRDEHLRLLIALDEATRLVTTAVVHTGHRPPLHTTLLARMCAPPGRWTHGGALASAPARGTLWREAPSLTVRPHTLVVDGTTAAGLRVLREACAHLGIHLDFARRLRPVDRQGVERTLQRFVSLFTDHLLSAAGRAAQEAGWPPEMVQDLLDAWVAHLWPDTPVPTAPAGGAHTPRTRHETLTASAGWTPIPILPSRLTAFLPAARRAVGSSGLRLGGRLYDSPALDPLRHAKAPGGRRRTFEVRWDPYDLRRVWLRAADDEWIAAHAEPPVDWSAAQPTLHHAPLESTEVYARTGRSQGQSGTGAAAPDPAAHHTVTVGGQSLQDWRTAFFPPPLPPLDDGTRTLPEDLRVAYHAQLPLRVPGVSSAVRRIEDVLAVNSRASGARYGVLLVGQSGTGKTTALWEAARRCATQDPDGGTVPMVYVRLAPATSPRLLLAELVRCLGVPVRGSSTTADLVVRVSEAMETARTRLVLIDEVHNLRGPSRFGAAVADVLDYLCDRVPATFAFAGIGAPDALSAEVTHAAQRRLVSVHLSALPLGADWEQVVCGAEAALRLYAHEPGSLTAQAGLLHRRTGGNVGRLAFLLRTAAVRAVREGTEQLTATLLSELPLPGQAGGAECSQPVRAS